MSRQEEVRLEMAVSDQILHLVDDALAGSMDEMPRGDVQAITEATAKMIIAQVRGEAEL